MFKLVSKKFLLLLTILSVMLGMLVSVSTAQVNEVSRDKTLVIENISIRNTTPDNFNPLAPGVLRHAGLQQVGYESLFYYNYETGELVPWLAESATYNDDFTELTINLRDGVKWSDGEAFDANDVVFTLNLLLEHSPELNYSNDHASFVDGVEQVDDLTVKIALNGPNPRYLLNVFGVRIYGATYIVPEHIFSMVDDPVTFPNFDLDAGYPGGHWSLQPGDFQPE